LVRICHKYGITIECGGGYARLLDVLDSFIVYVHVPLIMDVVGMRPEGEAMCPYDVYWNQTGGRRWINTFEAKLCVI
jgi:hypothetical protein